MVMPLVRHRIVGPAPGRRDEADAFPMAHLRWFAYVAKAIVAAVGGTGDAPMRARCLLECAGRKPALPEDALTRARCLRPQKPPGGIMWRATLPAQINWPLRWCCAGWEPTIGQLPLPGRERAPNAPAGSRC